MRVDGLSQEEGLLADTALQAAAGLAGAATSWPETWRSLVALGWPGVLVSPDVGGFGGSRTDLLLLSRALGAHLLTSPFIADAAVVASMLDRTTSTRPAQLLENHVCGEARVAFACQESPTDPDGEIVRTRVTAGRLSGQKQMVLFGADAKTIIVAAMLDDAPCLVSVGASDPGVAARSYRLIDGSEAADFVFADVSVADGQVLAEGRQALDTINTATLSGSLACVGEAIGCLDTALSETVRHLMTRQQFGGPLATFQVLRHRIADMYMAREELFSLGLTAARAEPAEFPAAVRAAKIYLGQDGVRAIEHGVQMHGAMGVTEECVAGRLLKRIIVLERLFGGADHQIEKLALNLLPPH